MSFFKPLSFNKSRKLETEIPAPRSSAPSDIGFVDEEVQEVSIPLERIAKIYENSPELQLVISKIALAICTLEAKIVEWSNEDQLWVPYQKESKLLKAFNEKPSPYQSRAELMYEHWVHRLVFSSAFLAMEQDKSGAILFTNLNPLYVKIVPDPVTKVKYYVYEVDGKRTLYHESKVLHIMEPKISNFWFGLCRIEGLIEDLDTAKFAKRQYRADFKRGKPGRIMYKANMDINTENMKLLKKQYMNRTPESVRNIIVPYGFDPIADTSNYTGDISAETAISLAKATIAEIYGVPLGLLQPQVNTDIRELEWHWWSTNLQPMCDRFALAFTHKWVGQFVKGSDTKFVFDYSPVKALQIYVLEEAKVATANISIGLVSVNEQRQALGKRPWPSEHAEFANTPAPVFDAEQAKKLKEDVNLPGENHGRDQSASGEPQMVDETGKKRLT